MIRSLKYGALAGGLAAAASLVAFCHRPVPTVYGPPPERDEEEAGPGEEFDPSGTVPEAVYGPPEDLGWD